LSKETAQFRVNPVQVILKEDRGTGIIAKDDRLGPMERRFCCYCLQRKIVNCHPLENRPAL
jgi:hypothetical protein